jgi:hypothetical protein
MNKESEARIQDPRESVKAKTMNETIRTVGTRGWGACLYVDGE